MQSEISMHSETRLAYIACIAFFVLNCAAWQIARPMQARWANVPPPPSAAGAAIGALGDRQFAFRTGGLMLQNFGDIGGRVTPLYKYDFNLLGKWFYLEDALDPRSVYVPWIAAYYYGGSQRGAEVRPVVDYLVMLGRRGGGGEIKNWRWMAQAVYLARFRLGDLNLALDLANELASMYRPGMPGWVKQMPVFVLNAKGDKAAAYALMTAILKDEGKTMQPQEVTSMMYYICQQLLTPDQAKTNPMCQALKIK
jgi:hypothetical protein